MNNRSDLINLLKEVLEKCPKHTISVPHKGGNRQVEVIDYHDLKYEVENLGV